MASWDDVPHLTEADKADMLASYPAFQRDARTKGVPQLGAGAIFPIEDAALVVEPFEIPRHWPRGYALDVGWKTTAATFGAHDRETDTLYLYDLYYRGEAEPDVHAAAIKRRGEWLRGVIDPAAGGRSQIDGEKLLQLYQGNGLHLFPAVNAVEAGLLEVYQRMSTGRLKVFKTLDNWWIEKRLYRRDDKGKVVKKLDHAMDATRYLVVSGIAYMTLAPDYLRGLGKAPTVRSDYDPHADY